MAYRNTLSEIIEASGLTLQEIADICNELSGESVSASYLSKLRGGKQAPASDQVNDAIARACNMSADISDRLRFEGAMEKLPEHTQLIIRELAYYAHYALARRFPSTHKTITPRVEQLPIDPLSILHDVRHRIESSGNQSHLPDALFDVNPTKSFIVKDDSMSPYIPTRSHVSFRPMDDIDVTKIPSGQFIVLDSKQGYYVRQLFLIEGRPILWAAQPFLQPEALTPEHKLAGIVERFTVPVSLLCGENP